MAAADELVEFAWKPLHLLALPGVKGIEAGPNLRNLARNLAAELFRSGPISSCRSSDDDLTTCRNHLADRAPANNEEHRKACRRQDQLEGQRRDRPMNVNDLGQDREASKNSDMILKGNLSLAAC